MYTLGFPLTSFSHSGRKWQFPAKEKGKRVLGWCDSSEGFPEHCVSSASTWTGLSFLPSVVSRGGSGAPGSTTPCPLPGTGASRHRSYLAHSPSPKPCFGITSMGRFQHPPDRINHFLLRVRTKPKQGEIFLLLSVLVFSFLISSQLLCLPVRACMCVGGGVRVPQLKGDVEVGGQCVALGSSTLWVPEMEPGSKRAVCVCVSTFTALVLVETRRGCWVPWTWGYSKL